MKKITTIIMYVFGGLLIITGLGSIADSIVTGILLVVTGIFLLPVVWNKIKVHLGVKVAISVVGFLLAMFALPDEVLEESQRKVAEKKAKKKLEDSIVLREKRSEREKIQKETAETVEIEKPVREEQSGAIGEIVVVKNSQPGCITRDVLKEFEKLGMAHDNVGIERLEQDGLIYELTPGTNLKVIENGFGWVRVRVMNGPYYGESFYTIAVN